MARKSCTGFDFTSVCFGVQVAVVEDGVSLGAAQNGNSAAPSFSATPCSTSCEFIMCRSDLLPHPDCWPDNGKFACMTSIACVDYSVLWHSVRLIVLTNRPCLYLSPLCMLQVDYGECGNPGASAAEADFHLRLQMGQERPVHLCSRWADPKQLRAQERLHSRPLRPAQHTAIQVLARKASCSLWQHRACSQTSPPPRVL